MGRRQSTGTVYHLSSPQPPYVPQVPQIPFLKNPYDISVRQKDTLAVRLGHRLGYISPKSTRGEF